MRNEIYKGRLIRVFILMFLFLSFLCSNSFAVVGGGVTAVRPYEDDNDVAYLAFELPSTSSSADYRAIRPMDGILTSIFLMMIHGIRVDI